MPVENRHSASKLHLFEPRGSEFAP